MKKITLLMLSFLATVAITSCEDNDEEFITANAKNELSFTSTPASSYILTFETRMNTAERFVWTPVEFTTPVAVTYTLEASTDPTNFDNPVIAGSSIDNSLGLTVERLNEISAELGLVPFSNAAIAMRVKATLADPAVEAKLSDVQILSVTPYTTESPKLWIPGNYAAASGYGADWTPSDPATPYIEAVEFGSTEYEGFVFMNVASPEFKITLEQDWDEAYGSGGAGLLDLSGGNLTVSGPGYYFIQVNTDPDGNPATNDATWSATAKVWSVIGAATPTGWGSDTNMTYNQGTKKWELNLAFVQDNFKFRANDDWGNPQNNFGINSDGELEFNAGDIAFSQTPGNYKVELDLSVPRAYTYTLTQI
ncbi:MAG: SusE domain-containing protein [Nonlabens sp.]|nr:SusE domain-containing protein [Nonlabens sp.]